MLAKNARGYRLKSNSFFSNTPIDCLHFILLNWSSNGKPSINYILLISLYLMFLFNSIAWSSNEYLLSDLFWVDLTWFDLIWFDLIWFDLIWFDLIWFWSRYIVTKFQLNSLDLNSSKPNIFTYNPDILVITIHHSHFLLYPRNPLPSSKFTCPSKNKNF